ncbi:MAG TPA: hypothetical protein VM821_05185 [Abditibacteriaceae bacterium]|jgi:anti-sigma-K factor RskA|nr:hypothetical protein [Abditibacteriaceae bacterium]
MKITQDDMMNWVDGTLDVARREEVEEYLAQHREDAELLADMKDALNALHDWNTAEPVAVGDNFWPRLREQLPERAGGQGVRGGVSRLAQWLWPQKKAWRISGAAAAFAVLAIMLALNLAPENATPRVEAAALSASERQFIRQSLVQHRAYAAVEPLRLVPLVPADGRNQDGDDGGGDSGDDEDYAPQ